MDELIEKYLIAKSKSQEYTKLMDYYNKKIKSALKQEPDNKYSSSDGKTAQVRSIYKSTLQKKNVPPDVWEKYSTTTPYEILIIKQKK